VLPVVVPIQILLLTEAVYADGEVIEIDNIEYDRDGSIQINRDGTIETVQPA
jgi:hypothetical protein